MKRRDIVVSAIGVEGRRSRGRELETCFDGRKAGFDFLLIFCVAFVVLTLLCATNLQAQHHGLPARIVLARDTVVWDAAIQISNLPNFSSVLPRIAAVNNYVYIMWVRTTSRQSYFCRSTDFGVSWCAPFLIPDTSVGFYGTSDFAVSGSSIYHFNEYTDTVPPYVRYTWLRRSANYGSSWENGRVIFQGGIRPNERAAFQEDVSVGRDSASQTPYFAHSPNRGETWQLFPRTLSQQPVLCRGLSLTKDPYVWRKLHYAREYGSAFRPEVSYTFSTDFGGTWRPEVFLSPNDSLASSDLHLCADTSGVVLVPWVDSRYIGPGGYGAAIYLRRSTDGGETFLSEQLVTEQHRGVKDRIALDELNPIAVLVWKDMPSIEHGEILCRVSFDRGNSWSQIYNHTPNSAYVATDPDVAVERHYIHVTWCYKTSATDYYQIYYRRGRVMRDTTEIVLGVRNGWMMVSVPVGVENYAVSAVFPQAVSSAYGFDSTYVVTDTLEPGLGYWLKFDTEAVERVRGRTIESDTIAVHAGWNLVGTISRPVLTGAVLSRPTGIIQSAYYTFGSRGDYERSELLEPGRAYWVKVSTPGILIRGP